MQSDLLTNLNESQRDAVQHVDGPLLVLAGAGSGKTRVITRRVAYLVQQGIPARNVLAITFTNKAAEEMRQRVAELNTPYGSTVCTFHALCARLLREFSQEAGLAQNYSIYDRSDQLKVAKKALAELNLPGAYLTPGKAHAAISNAKNQLQTAGRYAEVSGDFFTRNIAEVYRRYEQILAASNAVDFDDLLMRVAFLIRDYPDIRKYLADRYRYVLIDEYQDTNHAQYIIAHAIAMDHKNICATGDPDQSIYAWRGADINNILDFEKDYPNAKVVRLEENYRSVQPILTAASNLISNNINRKDKKLIAVREGGCDVNVVTVDDEHAEAREVALRIDKHRLDGGSYGDVAVFYRVNGMSRLLEEAFIRVGIPYRIARGVEFYNRKEIKDMLAYLKLLVNPTDDLSCLRVINTPTRGIGATTVKKLLAYGVMNGMNLLEAARNVESVGLSAGPVKKVRAFGEMITELAGNLERDVRFIMEDVFHRSGLEESLSKSDEESQQARSNIEELISTAAEFDEKTNDTDDGINEYLHGISLVSDVDHMADNTGAVTMMTLHAAKGLEFPVVFIVGCEHGMLPFSREPGMGDLDEGCDKLEEERRLMFVGMTRTEDQLTLSNVRVRMVRGQRLPQSSSAFLHEIGEDNIQRDDRTTRQVPERRKRRGGFFSDTVDRDEIEDRSDEFFEAAGGLSPSDDHEDAPPPSEYEHLKVGCMISHGKYGVGKVVKLSRAWPDTRATILFHSCGQKTIVLAYTNVEIVDPPF
ncbi:MAG: UvrD-helicase domain-containing protein [Phycisphaerae bacterium]|nr:UvrD-helicase domain-containing protein [Phycisphaerae bacterium]